MASIKALLAPRLISQCAQRIQDKPYLLQRVTSNINKTSAAGICHKDRLDPVLKAIKPKPWPYKEKPFTHFKHLLGLDNTTDRFDENTCIITVEGPPASGKTKLAKKLAEMTGMKHYEESNCDFLYVRPDGFDYRTLNILYYPEAQYPDIEMFLKNPHHPKIGRLQVDILKMRFYFYLESMIHLFNTGEGIVAERSPWSDVVFMEALYKCGYTNKEIRDLYARIRHNTLRYLIRPHLVIYIDTPVETVLKNIKKRNIPYEVNSKVWNSDFLATIEDIYKHKVLPELEEHSEMLIYPYKEELDAESILLDIEKMDFQVYMGKPKLADWRFVDEKDWSEWRVRYNNIPMYLGKFNCPTWDADGFDYSHEAEHLQLQTERALVPAYWPGFDPNKVPWYKLAFKREDNAWKNRLINQFKSTTL